MTHAFQPGQKFTMTNPDTMVVEEIWTVVEVDYPIIRFSCWRRWHIEKEYQLPTSTEAISARVVKEDATGVLLIDAHYTWQDVGYRIEGNQVTYLYKAMFQRYLSKSDRT